MRALRTAPLLLALLVPGCSAGGSTPTGPAPSSSATEAEPTVSALPGPASEVLAKVDVPGEACGVAGAKGSVWVSLADSGTLLRIDPDTGTVRGRIKVDGTPCELTYAHGSLWLVTQSGRLDRVDPVTGQVVARIRTGAASYEALSAFGAIWVSNRNSRTLTCVDPATNKATTVKVPDVQPGGLTAAGGYLWVGNDTGGERHVLRLDPATHKAVKVDAGPRPNFVAAIGDQVWTANRDDGTVSRIDTHGPVLAATVTVGTSPVNLAALGHDLWVPDDVADTVVRVDGDTGQVLETLKAGAGPAVVGVVGKEVWVSMLDAHQVWRIKPSRR